MFGFATIKPDWLIVITAVIAILISNNMDEDEMVFVGNFLTAVGDLLAAKADQFALQTAK